MREIETINAQFNGRDYPVDVLKNDALVAESIRQTGMWESWIADLMYQVQKPADVCCDVGANIGLHTILMSEQSPEGRVLAFEPLPVTADLLQTNLDRHGCQNAELYRLALSDSDGETQIAVDEDWLGNARLNILPGENAARLFLDSPASNLHQITVRKRRLDSLAAEAGIGRIDLMKVDVEGHENAFFDGAEAVIAANRDMIYITEHAPTAHEPHNRYEAAEFYISDFEYYRKCKRHFDLCYLIEQDHTLTPVPSYAMLRTLMISGRGVEDLLFCNRLPDALRDAVGFAPDINGILMPTGSGVLLPHGVAHIVNRYGDGWARVGLLKPWCQSALVVHTGQPVKATVTVHRPPAIPQLPAVGKICVNDTFMPLDVRSANQEFEVVFKPGRSCLFIETHGFMVPHEAIGSIGDRREIGIQWTVAFTA